MIRSIDNCPLPTNTAYNISLLDIEPISEPISLETAKKWLRMEAIYDDNDLITDLITEARMWVERYCALSIIPKTISCTINLHANGSVELPYGPIDLASIVVKDVNDNVLTTGFTLIGVDGSFIDIKGHGIFSVSYESISAPVVMLSGAIKSYIAYAYEHRGDALQDEGNPEFAKEAKRKAYPFMRQLFI